LYTGKKKSTVELTQGEIESLLEAAQTLEEVLQKEEEDTGESLSSDDRFLLKVLGRAASKLDQALPSK
jgi:methanogenic corrinoid protein MtbC1